MNSSSRPGLVVIICTVGIILQIVLAPNIAIANVMPNFVLIFSIALILSRLAESSLVALFIMGLLYNLVGHEPVGLLACVLLVVGFLAVLFVNRIVNISTPLLFIVQIISIFICELIYAALLVLFGADAGIADTVFFRVLPATLYDGLLGLVVLPLFLYLFRDPLYVPPSITSRI